MHRFTLALVLGFCTCLLFACPGDDDDVSGDDDATGDDDDVSGDDDTTGDDDSTPVPFELASDGLYPPDDATDAYYRTPILVRFTAPADTATVAMTDGDTGAAVDGTTEMTPDGRQVVFQPAVLLEREHAYQLAVDATGGEGPVDVGAEWAIRTSGTGGPLDHPQSVIGRVYQVDLSALLSVQPLLPAEFTSLLDTGVFLGVLSYDPGAGSIDVIGGSVDALSGDPDYCRQSVEFPPAEFLPTEDPHIQIGPADLVFPIEGFDVEILGVRISGTFAADASSFDGSRLTGMLDTGGLAQLLDDLGGACELLESVAGIACEACPDDGAVACVPVDLIELDGAEVPGPLYPVAADETENHLCDNCEDGLDNDGDGTMDGDEMECYSAVWP